MIHEHTEFVVRDVATQIFLGQYSCGVLCGKLAVFLKMNDLADEPGEDVEETSVFEGVFAELLFQGIGGKIAEEVKVLVRDDLEGGFRECGGIVVGDHIECVLAVAMKEVEVILVGEVALVTFGVPAGDVFFGDGKGEWRVGGSLEFVFNETVGKAVVEHMIDQVAQGFWEPGDLAPASAVSGSPGDCRGSCGSRFGIVAVG